MPLLRLLQGTACVVIVMWGATTALYAGSLFPVGKHVEFNLYYEHENNTGGHKSHPENAVGLALYLFFSVDNQ